MDQNFNSPVGQVAGGNINNYSHNTLIDRTDDELREEEREYRTLKYQALCRRFLNIPTIVLFSVLIFNVVGALYMLMNKENGWLHWVVSDAPSWLFIVYILIFLGLPMLLSQKIVRREIMIAQDCEAHLRSIMIEKNRRRIR